MLKLFCVASLSLVCFRLSAQNELDALRYSTIGAGGTARTLGMGGSFSAIGADASAAMINPAGIGCFRRGEFNFGFQFLNSSNMSTYIDEEMKDGRLNFNMPSLNLVIANVKYDENGKPKKRGLVNVNYGINMNRLASFSNKFAFDATNTTSSIADWFADKANAAGAGGPDMGSIGDLAYQGGAIYKDTGFVYKPYYFGAPNRNSQQTGDITSKGNIYEYQASVGVNFSHKLQLGLGLFYSSLSYTEIFTMLEKDLRPFINPSTSDMATLDYNFKLYDKGNAFGARFGFIFRPTDQLRLGASITTPRTFSIKSEFGYSVAVTGDPGSLSKPLPAFNEPLSKYDYKVTTPTKLNAGIGFVIQKILLINADFEFYNYAAINMTASDQFGFNKENSIIRKNYQNVTNLRLGAELNIPNEENKDQSYRLRVGFANLPSPYNAKAAGLDEVLKKSTNQYSCGFGFRDKNYYMDAALSFSKSANYYVPYTVADPGRAYSNITNAQRRTAFTFTVGFNFD